MLLPSLCWSGSGLWFTITGDPDREEVNTIQIDPAPLSVEGPVRTMAIRVSRNIERVSGDGIRFRSFSGTVEFRCDVLQARFVTSQFYDQPLWRSPGRLVQYPPTDVRPMAFREFEPNPRDRVMRAACGSNNAAAGRPDLQ
ncbi:hypothetical protein ASF43_28165 [Pseudorhodoferax sp. Leaf267]|nr:hypothetical protein ASF43_28165 [Pseudorhodoferax sp. Leaf267]